MFLSDKRVMMSYWCLPATMRSIWVSQSECAGTTSLVPMNLNKVNIFHRVHIVTITGGQHPKLLQGLHPTLLLVDDEILCVCATMKNTMPTYFPQWTPDDTRIWTKGSKFSHQKKSSHSWAVGRFSQICPHSPEYFHRACYPNIAFCQDSLPC